MTAFDDWLTEAATSRAILVELEPSETLGGWALTAAQVNTYEVVLTTHIQTAVVPGGVYRRVNAVRENATDLTERSSIATVEANAGSYWHDEDNELLYTHTTTGSDPDTFAAVQVFFTLFFATEPIDFVGGNLYEPRVLSRLPRIQGETENPLFGRKQYPQGDLELSNADGLFDILSKTLNWRNKKVTFRCGGGSLAFSDYEVVGVMQIEEMQPDDTVCRFELRHSASVLQQILPLETYTDAAFANLGEGVEGTYRPLLYGTKTDLVPPLIDTTSGANVYEIADPDQQVLTAITAVRAVNKLTAAITTLTLTTHYTIDLTNCRVTVTDVTYKWEDYEIRVDATGETDGAGGNLDTCGAIVKDLLLLLGVSTADIDTSSFSTADADNTMLLGVWVRQPRQAAEVIRLVETSVLGSVFVSRAGLWTFQVWDPGYDASTVPTLTDDDFESWKPDPKIASVFWKATVRYGFNFATSDWKSAASSEDRVKYETDSTDSVTLDTALTSSSDATVIAQRYRLIAGSQTTEVTLTERGISLITGQQFDKLLLTRRRAPSGSGAWVGQAVEILGFEKALAPPHVTLRVGDLRGFGERVGRWTDSSAPDWSAATEAEKLVSGFWANSAGLIDPADGTTFERSVWY